MNKQEFDERLGKCIDVLQKTMTDGFEETHTKDVWVVWHECGTIDILNDYPTSGETETLAIKKVTITEGEYDAK